MGTPVETNYQPTQQPTSNNQQPTTLKMKSLVTLVFLNIALARPDHGGVHHGAHHAVHHQPGAVHHAVHHQPAAVHHAVHHQPATVHHAVHVHQPMLHHGVHHAVQHHQPVHHNQVAPVVAKVAPKTLAELVVSEPRFSTLLAAVKAADLVETLNGEGAFTVFAPTNEELKKVLLRHVVPSTIQGKNIPPSTTTLDTAGG